MSEKIRKFMRNEKGFTLVEMMVVLIIMAVLIGAGLRAYTGYIGRAKITKATGDVSTMAAALDSYYQTQPNQGYPTGADALVAAGISTTQCNYDATATGIPYVYIPDATGGGYVIETSTPLDGTNYVVASGAAGQSGTAYTTPNVPTAP